MQLKKVKQLLLNIHFNVASFNWDVNVKLKTKNFKNYMLLINIKVLTFFCPFYKMFSFQKIVAT